jgi:hypothetical protein
MNGTLLVLTLDAKLDDRSALIWRPIYFVPVAAFPILASGLQIGLTVKYQASFLASDDMHCDYVDPMW